MKIRKNVAFVLSFLLLVQAPILTLAEAGDTPASAVSNSEPTEEKSSIHFLYGTVVNEETDKEIKWGDFPETVTEGQTFYVTLALADDLENDLTDTKDYTITADNAETKTEFSEIWNRHITAVTPGQLESLCIQAYQSGEGPLVTEKVLQVEKADAEKEGTLSDKPEDAATEEEVLPNNPEDIKENIAGDIEDKKDIVVDKTGESVEEASITFDYSEQTLIAGDTLQLQVNNSSEKNVTFSSNTDNIATVSEEGLVTAVTIGKCTITAKTESSSATCDIIVIGDIAITASTVTLYIGQTHTLQATTRPQGNVTWSSSADNIAAISQTGIITAKKAGQAIITANAHGISTTCKVIIKNKSLTLNKSKLTAYIGYKTTLTAATAPSATVKWKSSDTKKATVDSKGVITPKKTGQVTITATGNGISKTCTVTIKNPSLKLDNTKIYIFAGNSRQITAKAAPSNSVKWKSKNTSIATVDKNGLVKGNKVGKTTITVTHGKIKKTCDVHVVKNTYKLNKSKSTLMKGDSVKLYIKNVGADGNVSFIIESGSTNAVSISADGNLCTVKAKNTGTVTIRARYFLYIDGTFVECYNMATITVIESGISPQQSSVAVGTTKSFKVKSTESGKTVGSVVWSSSNKNAATIDSSTGLLTAKKTGTTNVSANIVYTDQTTVKHTTAVNISNPKLKAAYKVASGSTGYTIGIKGTNSYSNISWKSNKPTIARTAANGQVTVYSTIPQKVKITATVDGKKLSHQLIITNPTLKKDFHLLATGKTKTIKIKGKNAKSKITYKSKNKSIATVNSKGVVTAKRNGNASIEVTVDGKKMVFTAHVVSQKVISAVKKAESIMYSSSYSQAYRMSQGHYDCSSLTFRGYEPDGARLLGGSSSWAPTAAAQAWYLEARGKVISYTSLDVSELRPGDLIFYGGSYNGRFKNIYHVSMYYGGGYRLEKPLRYYYPSDSIVMIARPVS